MGTTLITERDGALALLTLNRPDKLNALNAELLAELDAAFEALSRDATVACAILTGAGDKAFAAGADIAAMVEMTTEQARAFSETGHRVCSRIERAPFPVIGALNGFALGGGCEIALACDFLYASEKAKLGQPEVNLGIIPGAGGTQRLPRLIGLRAALDLMLTGKQLDGRRAKSLGIVDEVVPAPILEQVARRVADELARGKRQPRAARPAACR